VFPQQYHKFGQNSPVLRRYHRENVSVCSWRNAAKMWHSRLRDGKHSEGTPAMMLIWLLATTLGSFVLLWLLSLRMQDASIADIWWGPGFVLLAAVAAWLRPPPAPWTWLFMLAVAIWGLRLGWHMIARHNGEDSRYARMRAATGESFGRRSLVTVFLLQGIVQFLAASPILTALLLPGAPNTTLIVLGLMLFVAGFLLEVVADAQLQRFRSNPTKKGLLMRQGLFAHIRHPNYLGEFILQIGLGTMAFGLSGSFWAFLGPILMIIIVSFVSGPPMQEESQRLKPGYEDWLKTTGRFLPRLGRR
jgi:steroid 5-alpha reductase family enzyme